MNQLKIKFDVVNTGSSSDLGIEIWIDKNKLLDQCVPHGVTAFEHSIDEDEADHQLKLILKNKTQEHTKVDEQDNIISDEHLQIENVEFDDMNIEYLYFEKCIYTHDLNGTQPKREDTFFGYLGCNGEVVFNFSTPFYIWLLENM